MLPRRARSRGPSLWGERFFASVSKSRRGGTFMSNTSPKSQPQKQKQTRTRITPSGWVMILLLLALGAINYADKAVLGLAAVPIIKDLHLSPTQYGLVSGSLFWLYALSSLLVRA